MRTIRHPAVRLILVGVVLALSHFQWAPFPWRQPAVALIAIGVILLEGEPLKEGGFRWPVPWRATVAWAAASTLVTCAVITPFVEPLLNRLTGTPADYSGYGALVGDLRASLQLIAYAWISAAIGEEIVFRGYLLHEARVILGPGAPMQALGVLMSAGVFGLSHYGQGLVGMLLTGLAGLLTGVVFLLSGRNIWAIILAHGLIDTWGVLTLYFGWI